MNRLATILACLLLPAISLGSEPAPGPAGGEIAAPKIPERMEPLPPQAEGVSVDEHFAAQLPLDATFKNESGQTVALGDLFKSGKPVILQLGYMSCPKLCDVIAQKTVDGLAEVPLSMGRDYSVLFISIDPNEKPKLASEKKQSYIQRYTDGGKHDSFVANQGWHFLTGDKDNIDRVAQAVGFNYRFDEQTQLYGHPSVLMVLSPDGKMSRYLYGAAFDPSLLKLCIVDAAAGKSGSVMDKIILLCVHIDPATGQYSVEALRIMRIGGVLSVFVLLGFMGILSLKGRKNRRLAPDTAIGGLAASVLSQPSSTTLN